MLHACFSRLVLVCTSAGLSTGLAAPWPAWRGPEGNGVCNETNVPLHWNAATGVRWHVPLPGPGNSTPVVWGNSVFVTQWIPSERRCTLICFDAKTGTVRWQTGPTLDEKETTHDENPPCSPSPVTDGERVIVWFGSAGIFAYDFRGNLLWHRDLGRQSHPWGYASSPVLYRDLCFLNFGPGKRSFLIALDKKSGCTVWQHDLPGLEPNSKWEDVGGKPTGARQNTDGVSDFAGSWATPAIVPAGEEDELILSCPLKVMAWAPRTGKLLWTCAGPNIGVYSSPFYRDGIVVLAANGFTNIVMAVKPGGRGDVTTTHRPWCRFMP
ncbi:MAG: PQQ-like beta-propeller repeat protein, partial [Verrucomicrobiae bacterium]|nr:PQQ-like beta-propeller repeat protein [Verrucomicrobiae bacterium]